MSCIFIVLKYGWSSENFKVNSFYFSVLSICHVLFILNTDIQYSALKNILIIRRKCVETSVNMEKGNLIYLKVNFVNTWMRFIACYSLVKCCLWEIYDIKQLWHLMKCYMWLLVFGFKKQNRTALIEINIHWSFL